MSHYTLATPLDTWQKIRDDMVAKGVDPDVALANAKEVPAATGNTPVDEDVYKCIRMIVYGKQQDTMLVLWLSQIKLKQK